MKFDVDLTNAERERLALLAEECGEVVQIIGKILRHGYESRHPDGGPTNRELLQTEAGHVGFAMLLCERFGDMDGDAVDGALREKSIKIGQYLHFQDHGPGAMIYRGKREHLFNGGNR